MVEINIPKIITIKFDQVIEHIEEIIFRKIKHKHSCGFDWYEKDIKNIICKIIGITNSNQIENISEENFEREYKGKKLS